MGVQGYSKGLSLRVTFIVLFYLGIANVIAGSFLINGDQ